MDASDLPGCNPDSEPAPSDRRSLFRHGHVSLARPLPMVEVGQLNRCFQSLADQGELYLDEYQGTRRFVGHNLPAATEPHQRLWAPLQRLLGRPIKPSYSYVSIYLPGSDLKWHADRPPCEYTLSLLLDYAPVEASGRSPWPLLLRERDGRVRSIHQRIGDALLFKGRELRHARPRLPEGHRSNSLLLHYVDADYQGVLE